MKAFLKSLAAAALGGAMTAATQALSSGTVKWSNVGTAAAGAIVTSAAYVLKSPLQPTTPEPGK